MAEPYVDVEQVIDDVLEAEREAEDVIDDAVQDGDVAETDAGDACGELDGLPEEQLLPALDDDALRIALQVLIDQE